jgi:PilZ domain-containing protein
MRTLFDIVKRDRKGTFQWLGTVNDIETAKALVAQLSLESSDEFIVFCATDLQHQDARKMVCWSWIKNDTAERGKRNQRLFDGRNEKRLPTSIPVYLANMEDPRAGERTLTENVSPHGARIISKRSWHSGEEPLVTPLTGEFPQLGRVIYCLPKTGDRFRLGVEFPDHSVKWDDQSRI